MRMHVHPSIQSNPSLKVILSCLRGGEVVETNVCVKTSHVQKVPST